MSDKEGKWLTFNKTGSPHECRKRMEMEIQMLVKIKRSNKKLLWKWSEKTRVYWDYYQCRETTEGIMTEKEKEITHCSNCGDWLEFERGACLECGHVSK